MFPCTRLTCRLKEEFLREAHWWWNLPCCLILVLVIRELNFIMIFFLVFLLDCISHLFAILIDFPWCGKQTGALGTLAEATLHQKLVHKSYLISRKAFFIIRKVISNDSGTFLMYVLHLLIFMHCPSIIFTEKPSFSIRKNHRTNLHWESANLAIWVLLTIPKKALSLLGVSIGLHLPISRH